MTDRFVTAADLPAPLPAVETVRRPILVFRDGRVQRLTCAEDRARWKIRKTINRTEGCVNSNRRS